MTLEIRNKLYELVEGMKDKLSDQEYKLFVEELGKIQANEDYLLSIFYVKYHPNQNDMESQVFTDVAEFQLKFHRSDLKKTDLDRFDQFFVKDFYRQIPIYILLQILPHMYHDHLNDILVPYETKINGDDDDCGCPQCCEEEMRVVYKTNQVMFKITKVNGESLQSTSAAEDGLDTASSSSDEPPVSRVVDSDDESSEDTPPAQWVEEEDNSSSESNDIEPPEGWENDDWWSFVERMCDISDGKYLNVVSGKQNVRSPKLIVNEEYKLCALKQNKKKLDDVVKWFEQFKDPDFDPDDIPLMVTSIFNQSRN